MKKIVKYIFIAILTICIISVWNLNYSLAANNNQGYSNTQKNARDLNGNGTVSASELIEYFHGGKANDGLNIYDIKIITEGGKADELTEEELREATRILELPQSQAIMTDGDWVQEFEKVCESKIGEYKDYQELGYTNLQGRVRDLDGDGTVTGSELLKYFRSGEANDSFNIHDIKIITEDGQLSKLTDEEFQRAKEVFDLPGSQAAKVDFDGKPSAWADRFENAYNNRFGIEEEDDDNDNEGKSNTAGEAGTADEIMQKADNWISAGEQAYKDENSINKGLFESTVEQAYNLLLAIGFVVIVIVGVILAIQFMLASADQKAIIKQKMLPYLTGCCVIFGAFGIWGMVIRLFGDPSGVSEYGKIGNLGSVEDADMIKTLGNNIIGILQIAGSFIAIIMLIVLGIKYMIGSAEEKAEYKVTMKNYVVGALLLFGIVNFIGAVQTMALGIFG